MSSNLKKWNIDEDPIAFYAGKKGLTSADSFPLYIPVLMPLITKGIKKTSSKTINKSCFANAKNCMPSIASTIKYRNYMNIERKSNEKFSKKYLHYNDKIRLNSNRSDENQLTVSNDLDPSTDS